MRAGTLLVSLAITASLACAAPPAADAPRVTPDGYFRLDLVQVTLRDGVLVRARDGALTDFGTGALDLAAPTLRWLAEAGATWERAYVDVSEARLDELRANATRNLNKPTPDLNLQFNLRLPGTLDTGEACTRLESLGVVRRAEMALTGKDGDPVPPNLIPNQRYRNAPTMGINVDGVAGWPGARGENTQVCDVERQWRLAHGDLPAMTRLGPATSGDPNAASNDHGTAVMGICVSRDNGFGTIGSVPDAAAFYAHVYTNNAYNVAAAIVNSTAGLQAGAMMMIEQQMVGPTGGVVAMEWQLANYNAIVTAVGNGITVIEAAGNGNQNFDAAAFSTGNGGHWPFLLANDSGAIMVGAAAGNTNASTTARSRLTFSNYGATLDLQGWGENVTTLGYGDAYAAEGVNLNYTHTFSGTSSATPIVTSAAAILQSVYKEVTGNYLTPAQIRQHLRATGQAQTSGINPATQNIGPYPNVRAAIADAFGNNDCNANTIPDAIDIALGTATDANANGVPDSCECIADVDDGTGTGTPDGGVDIADLLYYLSLFEAGNLDADVDDGTGTGTPDNGVDISDLLYFLVRFGAGC